LISAINPQTSATIVWYRLFAVPEYAIMTGLPERWPVFGNGE